MQAHGRGQRTGRPEAISAEKIRIREVVAMDLTTLKFRVAGMVSRSGFV